MGAGKAIDVLLRIIVRPTRRLPNHLLNPDESHPYRFDVFQSEEERVLQRQFRNPRGTGRRCHP